jgi:DDE superfamily endonuclease/Winged helix-turn helix
VAKRRSGLPRALIVLAAGSGQAINAIAKEFQVSRPTVYLWRERFEQAGVLGLVKDAPTGTSEGVAPEKDPSDRGRHVAHHAAGCDALERAHHGQGPGVSHAIVHRIWTAHGLQPHRVETFKLSRDPDFVLKLRDVVGVYLHPPDKALVFCVDEKPQVQALDRTEPVLPLRPGIRARQTHDYVRHGTTNLFAALNILDGTVLARCARRKRHTEFLAFLEQLDRSVAKRRKIHLILDNYSTHRHPNVEAWFAARPGITATSCRRVRRG